MKTNINKKSANNNWEHLAGCDWARLLEFQPRFADKCDWSKLDGDDWTALLKRQPQFADKCDWVKLEGRHWMALLRTRPEITASGTCWMVATG